MSHSENLYTSTHSLPGEVQQDPQERIELDPWTRRVAAIREVLANPPKGPTDPIVIGRSRMIDVGKTTSIQDKAAYRPCVSTFESFPTWMRSQLKVGRKDVCEFWVAGVSLTPEANREDTFVGSQMVALDLDGLITCDADLVTLDATLELVLGADAAWYRHTSASHLQPGKGHRWRVAIPLAATISVYAEHTAVAAYVLDRLAEAFPGRGGIDACAKKAMQPMYCPSVPDQAAVARWSDKYKPGTIHWDPTAVLEAHRAEKAAVKEVQQLVHPLVAASVGAPPMVEDNGTVDKLELCRADLQRMPIHAGSGVSNSKLAAAVWRCREWGLDVHQAELVMVDTYGPQGQSEVWLRAKCRSIYGLPDREGQDGRRLGLAQTRSLLAGVREFGLDLDGGPHTAIKREEGRYVDQTVTGPHNPGAPEGGGPHNPPAANLPPGLRSIGGIPVVLVHMRHLPIMAHIGDQRPKLLGVRSPCGTGKSFAVRLAIHRALVAGERVVVVVPRRSLARALAADLGLPCYLDQVGDIEGSTVVCLDSVHRVTPYRFDGIEVAQASIGLLVLDEVQQLVRHAFGGTLKKKRGIDRCWGAMKKLCGVATKIRASDAGLDPLAAHILRAWVGPEATAEILDNTYRPSAPVDTFIRRSETSWMREVGKEIAKGRKIWIYFTSKRACKAIAKRLASQNPGKRVLVIHSEKTSGEAKECLQDTRKFSEWDIVCCTGSVGTGVSVEHVEIWSVFGHLTATKAGRGPIAPDVYQGLSRVRSPLENRWHLCLLGRGQKTSDDPAEHLADLLRLTADTRARLDGITDFEPKFGVSGKPEMVPENEELLRAYCQVLAYEGCYGGNYHDRILEDGTRVDGAIRRYWADLGVGNVIDLDIIDEANAQARTPAQAAEVKEVEKDLKLARKEVDADDDVTVATAGEVTHEEAEKLEAGEDRTPEICAQITNERLRRRYDLEHLTPEDVSWDRKNWGHAVHFANAYLWQQGERQGLLAGDARAGGCSLHWRHAHQGSELLAALWKKCGISDFEADAQAGVSIKSPGAILQSRIIREGLRRVLGMEFKAEDLADGMSLVRSLARRCGLKLKSTRPRGTGARKRVYTLDATQVQELLAKTSAYRARIKDPKRAPEVYVGPTAEETAAFLAALVADEDFIKIKRAA